jgi:hypothetical protein
MKRGAQSVGSGEELGAEDTASAQQYRWSHGSLKVPPSPQIQRFT